MCMRFLDFLVEQEQIEWKQVVGDTRHPGLWPYEVSNDGRVRNISGKEKALWKHWGRYRGKEWYTRVTLYRKGSKQWGARVHRLVAAAFIPNPHNYNEVDHKDGNTHNNNVTNLEWVPPEENLHRRSIEDR